MPTGWSPASPSGNTSQQATQPHLLSIPLSPQVPVPLCSSFSCTTLASCRHEQQDVTLLSRRVRREKKPNRQPSCGQHCPYTCTKGAWLLLRGTSLKEPPPVAGVWYRTAGRTQALEQGQASLS